MKKVVSVFVLFGLVLSSCDKKNAYIVNRRIATPERIEEIKEEERKRLEKEKMVDYTPIGIDNPHLCCPMISDFQILFKAVEKFREYIANTQFEDDQVVSKDVQQILNKLQNASTGEFVDVGAQLLAIYNNVNNSDEPNLLEAEDIQSGYAPEFFESILFRIAREALFEHEKKSNDKWDVSCDSKFRNKQVSNYVTAGLDKLKKEYRFSPISSSTSNFRESQNNDCASLFLKDQLGIGFFRKGTATSGFKSLIFYPTTLVGVGEDKNKNLELQDLMEGDESECTKIVSYRGFRGELIDGPPEILALELSRMRELSAGTTTKNNISIHFDGGVKCFEEDYKIIAVNVHGGSKDRGHYWSYVESSNGGIDRCDDKTVTHIDAKDLEKEKKRCMYGMPIEDACDRSRLGNGDSACMFILKKVGKTDSKPYPFSSSLRDHS